MACLSNLFFRYSAEEIHFNLMAIVSSRKAIHLKDIDRLNQKRTQILDNVCIVKYSDSDKILSKRSSVVL